MEKKSDSDGENVHSLWSQDTELFSVPSEENNLSMEISSSVLRLEPDDSDQSGRNVPFRTACSTPHHKSKSSSKRRFETSSDGQSPRSRKKKIEKSSLSPVQKPAASNETQFTNGSDGEIPSAGTSKKVSKKSAVVYAEANSSTISAEQSSNQKSDSQASTKSSKQKHHDKEGGSKDSKKRHFTEEFICSITYTIDETKKDIVSLHIREVNRLLCDSKNASNKLSVSSGALADISGSDGGNSGYSGIEKLTLPPKLSVTSTASSSSVSSSSSSLPSTANKLQHSLNTFLVPEVSELKKQTDYRCKGKVCHCFCSKVVNCLLKQSLSSRPITPEIMGSSSENLKTDSQEFDGQEINHKRLHKQDISKIPVICEEVSDESKFPCNSSQSSIYVPSCTNLPVFAKWPGNSWFYPGIIEDAEEDTWHTSSHLEVKFCDGTLRRTRTTNLFPAYLLPSNTEVTYEKEGILETAIITSVNRLPNNELLLVSESAESIPFQKICFSSAHYKELLKENSDVLTPRKNPKFSISIANVQEGKRTRKVVRSDSSGNLESKPKHHSSSKKTPSSKTKDSKRGRSTTDDSSTDQAKSEKKSKQKKSKIETKDEETNTPHHLEVELERKEVARKLCLDTVTPGCSYKECNDSKQFDSLEQLLSTDTESSGDQKIFVDEISYPTLDKELILDISRRALRTKSSSKKTTAYNPKNQENIHKLGPLPELECFSTYNFVLTHSKEKDGPVPKISQDESYSEEETETDFEDYYETTVPFDYLWLREQIIFGGGKVYKSLLDIHKDDYLNTIVITNNIFETPNYLLAVSLGIPIYRHDLIVNCCIQKKNLREMLSHAMKMPNGRSLESGLWVETSSPCSLKGYCCLLSLNVNNSTIEFWKMLLLNTGATVMDGNEIKIISELQSRISFIIGDASLSEEILTLANCYEIPVVSTLWVSQTLIHGKPRRYDALPEYNIHHIPT